jgi:hypothetical protein
MFGLPGLHASQCVLFGLVKIGLSGLAAKDGHGLIQHAYFIGCQGDSLQQLLPSGLGRLIAT